MMSTLCSLLFLLTFVSYCRAQMQNTSGRIVAGCTIGGLFVLCFLLLIVILAGSRRRRQPVVGGSANQHESRKRSGRSHPVQHNAASTTPYRPQGAQTVQHDENDDYYHSQGGPPPPAYDADVKDAYFSQSSGNGNGIEGQMASDIAYNPPPFPPSAHLDGQ